MAFKEEERPCPQARIARRLSRTSEAESYAKSTLNSVFADESQSESDSESDNSSPENENHRRDAELADSGPNFDDDDDAAPPGVFEYLEQSADVAATATATSPTTAPVQSYNKNSSGQWECATCGQKFGRKFHLKRHLTSHIGNRPFQCGICSATFARSDVLAKHRQTHLVQPEKNESQETFEEQPPALPKATPPSPRVAQTADELSFCLEIARESSNHGTHSEIVKGVKRQTDQDEKRRQEREKGVTMGLRLQAGLVPQRTFIWIRATYEKQYAGQQVSWNPTSNPCAIVRANMAIIDQVPEGGHLFIFVRSTSGLSLDRCSFKGFVEVVSQKLDNFTMGFPAITLADFTQHTRWLPFPGLGLVIIFPKRELCAFFLEDQPNADIEAFIDILEREDYIRVHKRKWLTGRIVLPQEE
ncbi:hypothetical protein HDK77DRAFT_113174 [Phyllosticta capitalensis]